MPYAVLGIADRPEIFVCGFYKRIDYRIAFYVFYAYGGIVIVFIVHFLYEKPDAGSGLFFYNFGNFYRIVRDYGGNGFLFDFYDNSVGYP